MLKRMTLAGVVLAFVVVVLGAYTRLTDAGLGCPDWPGCYGQLTVPDSGDEIARAEQAFPGETVDQTKAWNEMVHRYFAGSLGLLILAIAVLAFRQRRLGAPAGLALGLLVLVCFQALLGMWTVTWDLLPLVVMAHLLGGFTTLALLFLLALRLYRVRTPLGQQACRSLLPWTGLGLVLLVAQIALGGWTSANYAALVCTELPICEGDWTSRLAFADAFGPTPSAASYEFGVLDYAARMTIHVTHRLGAIVLALYLVSLILLLRRRAPGLRHLGQALAALLAVQIGLGISNVVFILPLPVAVAHNAVAALLVLSLVAINYTLWVSRTAAEHDQVTDGLRHPA